MDKELKQEVHWYQCKNVGKVEFKLKIWGTENENKMFIKYIGKSCVSFEKNKEYELVSEIMYMGKDYYLVIDESGEAYPYKPELFQRENEDKKAI